MRSFSAVPGDSQCECSDPGCPAHLESLESSECFKIATIVVYRIDMNDETGTFMCDECACDALDSGVFTTVDEDGFEEEE